MRGPRDGPVKTNKRAVQASPTELALECGPCGQLQHPVGTVALPANERAAHFAEMFPG